MDYGDLKYFEMIDIEVIHLWRPQKMTTFVTPAPPASTKKAKDLLFKNNRIRKRDKCQDPPHLLSVSTS